MYDTDRAAAAVVNIKNASRPVVGVITFVFRPLFFTRCRCGVRIARPPTPPPPPTPFVVAAAVIAASPRLRPTEHALSGPGFSRVLFGLAASTTEKRRRRRHHHHRLYRRWTAAAAYDATHPGVLVRPFVLRSPRTPPVACTLYKSFVITSHLRAPACISVFTRRRRVARAPAPAPWGIVHFGTTRRPRHAVRRGHRQRNLVRRGRFAADGRSSGAIRSGSVAAVCHTSGQTALSLVRLGLSALLSTCSETFSLWMIARRTSKQYHNAQRVLSRPRKSFEYQRKTPLVLFFYNWLFLVFILIS